MFMEAMHSSPLSISSSLTKQSIPRQSIPNLPFIPLHKNILTSKSKVQIHALNDAIHIATASSAPPHGDISVLIPISSVLLFMYWVANFVVPDIVSKDLQKKASELVEQKSELEKYTDEASETPKTKQKIKKADLKDIINAKMNRKA